MPKKTDNDKGVEEVAVKLLEQSAKKLPAKEDVHVYFKYEKKFLDVYAETFDFKLALRESGMKAHEVRKNTYLMDEVGYLQKILQKSHRLKAASGKHIELMEKFEEQHDKLVKKDKAKEAANYASTLSRMSDSAMRASGEFREVDRETGMQVSININMGSDYKDAEIMTEEGEVIEVSVDEE